MIHDENEYHFLRQQLLRQPTIREHVRASRIASQIDFNGAIVPNDPLIKSKLLKKQQRSNGSQPLLIISREYMKNGVNYFMTYPP